MSDLLTHLGKYPAETLDNASLRNIVDILGDTVAKNRAAIAECVAAIGTDDPIIAELVAAADEQATAVETCLHVLTERGHPYDHLR